MYSIQTNLSDYALITAIRANLNEFYHHLGRSFPDEHFENEKFTRWHTPIQHPWFNGVLSSELPEPKDETFITETIDYFRSKKVGEFTWWMEPHLKPSTWESVLSTYAFKFSSDTPGMAVDIQKLNNPSQTADGLEVRVVVDEESLRTWAHVFTIGYSLPLDWESSVYHLQQKLGLGFPLRNYIGYLNGEPVSTSAVFFGAGVAGIYSVSTLPQARGYGIGAAVTVAPLLNAFEMGYRIGVLQSSKSGYSLYKKLGFRHLCQIEYFYLGLH